MVYRAESSTSSSGLIAVVVREVLLHGFLAWGRLRLHHTFVPDWLLWWTAFNNYTPFEWVCCDGGFKSYCCLIFSNGFGNGCWKVVALFSLDQGLLIFVCGSPSAVRIWTHMCPFFSGVVQFAHCKLSNSLLLFVLNFLVHFLSGYWWSVIPATSKHGTWFNWVVIFL